MTPFAAEISRTLYRFVQEYLKEDMLKSDNVLEDQLVSYLKRYFMKVEKEQHIQLPPHNASRRKSVLADIVISRAGENVPINICVQSINRASKTRTHFWEAIDGMNVLIDTVKTVDAGFVIFATNQSLFWEKATDKRFLDEAQFSLLTGTTEDVSVGVDRSNGGNKKYYTQLMWIQSHDAKTKCCLAQQSIRLSKSTNAIPYETIKKAQS